MRALRQIEEAQSYSVREIVELRRQLAEERLQNEAALRNKIDQQQFDTEHAARIAAENSLQSEVMARANAEAVAIVEKSVREAAEAKAAQIEQRLNEAQAVTGQVCSDLVREKTRADNFQKRLDEAHAQLMRAQADLVAAKGETARVKLERIPTPSSFNGFQIEVTEREGPAIRKLMLTPRQ